MLDVQVVDLPARPTAVVHEHVPMAELPDFFGRALPAVYAVLQRAGVPPAGEPFALYHGTPTDSVDVEAGFPVASPIAGDGEVVPSELPAGSVATVVHVGPYEAMRETYAELHAWMAEHHYTPSTDVWEVYLSDPRTEPDPATWRTEIFWPVTPAS